MAIAVDVINAQQPGIIHAQPTPEAFNAVRDHLYNQFQSIPFSLGTIS